jgi:hypothetical protein
MSGISVWPDDSTLALVGKIGTGGKLMSGGSGLTDGSWAKAVDLHTPNTTRTAQHRTRCFNKRGMCLLLSGQIAPVFVTQPAIRLSGQNRTEFSLKSHRHGSSRQKSEGVMIVGIGVTEITNLPYRVHS